MEKTNTNVPVLMFLIYTQVREAVLLELSMTNRCIAFKNNQHTLMQHPLNAAPQNNAKGLFL